MPPERQSTQKRRHLPFKPPSRASGSSATTAGASTSKPPTKTTKTPKTTTTASSSKSKPSKTTSKPKPAKASSSRQKPSPSPSATNSNSSSDAESDTNSTSRSPTSGPASDDEDANDANYILAEITHAEPAEEDVLSSEPLIPPKLLTKLVHHHFRNEKTKIAKDANEVVAKYIDVFVREAVARAAFERAEEGNVVGGGRGGGRSVADGFLEVEDLEKMGPQLAMDF